MKDIEMIVLNDKVYYKKRDIEHAMEIANLDYALKQSGTECVKAHSKSGFDAMFIDMNNIEKLIAYYLQGEGKRNELGKSLQAIANELSSCDVFLPNDTHAEKQKVDAGHILKSFVNQEFGTVRIVLIDDEVWFIGKDVAEALGYSNASKAVMCHVDKDDKQFVMLNIADSQNGNMPIGQSKTAVINESGLYSLILSSKLPTAKKFKHWITSDVLPTLRKTGGYISDASKVVDTYFGHCDSITRAAMTEIFKAIESMQNQIKELKQTNDYLAHQSQVYEPKKIVTALMRSFASKCLRNNYRMAWNILYKDLRYKKDIYLAKRKGNGSMLDKVKDSEWDDVLEIATAICKNNGVDLTASVNSVNAQHLMSV